MRLAAKVSKTLFRTNAALSPAISRYELKMGDKYEYVYGKWCGFEGGNLIERLGRERGASSSICFNWVRSLRCDNGGGDAFLGGYGFQVRGAPGEIVICGYG